MNELPIYAIVDIEATSGSLHSDEGMIQFACILFQDGRVLEEFNTLVNPLKQVPVRIQELTGITQQDVDYAPLFEEIAPIIHELLQETIFVAHNVAFDFEFLNEQFQRVGLPSLEIPAMDTVVLSQILFPNANYYNLQELTEWLGYDLDTPHDALYDARATVFLLRQLLQKVGQLPVVTLQQLAQLGSGLPYQSVQLFQCEEKFVGGSGPLAEGLMLYNGVAIREPQSQLQSRSLLREQTYPETTVAKQAYFKQSFTLRPHQGQLMDLVYEQLSQLEGQSQLAIEAPSGLGKSIGYLFPSVIAAEQGQPVIISTYTTVLQHQLLTEAIPLLSEQMDRPLQAVLIKGKRHYLSLDRFIYQLDHSVQPGEVEAFICMQVLVWLTETETGDLDELGISQHQQHTFWETIRVSQTADHTVDFYQRMLDRAQYADLIIVNHAYLLTHLDDFPLFQSAERIIFDEAHHLLQAVRQVSTAQISKKDFNGLMKELGHVTSEGSVLQGLDQLVDDGLIPPYLLETIQSYKVLLTEEWHHLMSEFHVYLPTSDGSDLGWQEVAIDRADLSSQLFSQSRRVLKLIQALHYYLDHIDQIAHNQSSLQTIDHYILADLRVAKRALSHLDDTFELIFQQIKEHQMSWVSFYSDAPEPTLQLKTFSRKRQQETLQRLLAVNHVLYISSTLSVNHSVQFFKQQLGLDELPYVELSSPYQFQTQAQIIVPSDIKPIKKLSHKYLARYISDCICTVTKQLNRKTLILFHSLDLLQSVYEQLMSRDIADHYRLLAQNISGSQAKVLKRFKQSDQAILLGADSFFEGIDLPGDQLEVIILTRLPFDSPDMPLVQQEHQRLKQAGQNIFMEDILPRAIVKTKQAFGRLIRSEADKGVFIILDDRFKEANYSKLFQESLPNGKHYQSIPMTDISSWVNEFLSANDC